jgi:hypothetical protein
MDARRTGAYVVVGADGLAVCSLSGLSLTQIGDAV